MSLTVNELNQLKQAIGEVMDLKLKLAVEQMTQGQAEQNTAIAALQAEMIEMKTWRGGVEKVKAKLLIGWVVVAMLAGLVWAWVQENWRKWIFVLVAGAVLIGWVAGCGGAASSDRPAGDEESVYPAEYRRARDTFDA